MGIHDSRTCSEVWLVDTFEIEGGLVKSCVLARAPWSCPSTCMIYA
jgi:hypothetical protein